ncbi:hypothetical protein EGH25_09020 [Haladaptatus sp. F3-133]|jgi:hypothetical protein|uniref:Uncharacterized protein n=1 Tax=Halorutilus salinus TaxID=2487751 RepID=A0A9Q4C6V0_9EURY|nr:hypothetical protein [Halorutilus salinus]MCX2819489.1 hypothetical protein [Halorutilus salinus]
MRLLTRELNEAEQLLEELESWSEEEIEELPRFYSEKAKELRETVRESGE